MGALTTHVLDTSAGKPGSGIRLDLYRIGKQRQHLITTMTNEDGRCDQALLQDSEFSQGEYEIVFQAGEYFAGRGIELPEPPFLNQVVIRFSVSDASEHYHVPLLLSPYGYSTYRGS